MKLRFLSLIILALLASYGCLKEPIQVGVPQNAEMIFWESRSWETGGGRARFTLWADGRSEILVVPDFYTRRSPEKLRPREGWEMGKGPEGVYFKRKAVFPESIVKERFSQSFQAGIHLLEPFSPNYVDGGGTLIGIQIDGELNRKVIPYFTGGNRGTENHKRFLEVAKVLDSFNTDAYEIVK